jgi:hypothetical protein
MARVGQYELTPAAVPRDRHHGGVVYTIKSFVNGLVEIAHESALFQRGKVLPHEISKLSGQHRHCLPMTAYVRQGDAGDDATWANGNVVDVAARLAGPGRDGMYPGHQAGQLD